MWLGSTVAIATSCSPATVCQLMSRGLQVAFVGEVVAGGVDSLLDDPSQAPACTIRVRVIEILGGIPAGQAQLTIEVPAYSGLDCQDTHYFAGERYLFFSARPYQPKRLWFSGRRLKDLEEFGVSLLREYFAGRLVPQLRGRVLVTRHGAEAVKLLTFTNEAKPAGGTVVSAISTDGRRFSARTDTEGRYVLPLPQGGRYRLKAARTHHTAEPEIDELVPDQGCAVQNFALQSGNQLSGFVRDTAGRPQKHIFVRLIDLDRPWRAEAYTEQKDSSFLFRDVPLGRYLLAVDNPDGSLPEKPFFATTFYPGSATRKTAKVIELARGGVNLRNLDLTLGPKVPLRTVRVRVAARRAGGEALDHLSVEVDAVPRSALDLPWHTRSSALNRQDDWHEFRIPADRRVRIGVKDWYGRTTPGQYVSLHEPGVTPIVWEVAINPPAAPPADPNSPRAAPAASRRVEPRTRTAR